MSFPKITSKMVPLLSSIGELPEDLDLNYEDGCFYLRVPIGESDCGRWLTTVDVGYRESRDESPYSGIMPIDYMSFGYEISVFDQVDNEVFQTMDPYEARCAIPQDMRPLVVDITCECYQRLIGLSLPDYIYRFTKDADPSVGAMVKHKKCTEALIQGGFSVIKEWSDQSGRKFWLLARDGLKHVNVEQGNASDIGVGK